MRANLPRLRIQHFLHDAGRANFESDKHWKMRQISIHVQYTQTESIRLRHFTIRLDSHVTSQLDSHGVASRKSSSGMTNRQQGKRFVSIRQHFQPTLHSPPEVKIREITIHEPSLFLKRGTKLQSIRTIRVDSIESTRIDNIFNPPSKSRSTLFSNRQKGKRFVSIKGCSSSRLGV